MIFKFVSGVASLVCLYYIWVCGSNVLTLLDANTDQPSIEAYLLIFTNIGNAIFLVLSLGVIGLFRLIYEISKIGKFFENSTVVYEEIHGEKEESQIDTRLE